MLTFAGINHHIHNMKNFILLIFAICACTLGCYAQEHSIGLYMIKGDTETTVNPIKYKNIKISGVFNRTARLEYSGAQSQNRFNGTAKFKFVFGAVNVNNAASHYMFSPSYSITDFGVARFDVKKGKRYLTTMKIKSFGTSSTMAEEVEDIEIKTTKIDNGIYEMEITATPGEYCIMFTSYGTGGYSGVFDFGID